MSTAVSPPARTSAQLKKESMPDWGLKFLAELQLRGTVTRLARRLMSAGAPSMTSVPAIHCSRR